MSKFNEFAAATAERAIKTFAQTEASLLIAGGTGLFDTDWRAGLGVSGMAAVLSVLTSIGSSKIGGSGPSVVDAERLA